MTSAMPSRMARSVEGMRDVPHGSIRRRSAPGQARQGPYHVSGDRLHCLERPNPGHDVSVTVNRPDVPAHPTAHHASLHPLADVSTLLCSHTTGVTLASPRAL